MCFLFPEPYVQCTLGALFCEKAKESSACRLKPTFLLLSASTAWASGRNGHQALTLTAVYRNVLNQVRLQICPAWDEKVINVLQRIRKGLGNESRELSNRRWTKLQQSLEHGKRQRAVRWWNLRAVVEHILLPPTCMRSLCTPEWAPECGAGLHAHEERKCCLQQDFSSCTEKIHPWCWRCDSQHPVVQDCSCQV